MGGPRLFKELSSAAQSLGITGEQEAPKFSQGIADILRSDIVQSGGIDPRNATPEQIGKAIKMLGERKKASRTPKTASERAKLAAAKLEKKYPGISKKIADNDMSSLTPEEASALIKELAPFNLLQSLFGNELGGGAVTPKSEADDFLSGE